MKNVIFEHNDMTLEPHKTSTNGGQEIEIGLRNITPDLLERLYVQGFLKGPFDHEKDANRRVCNGRALQELYMEFRSMGKDPAAATTEYREMVTLVGHIGSERDLKETQYHRTLHIMGKYGRIVRSVCIEGEMLGMKDRDLRKALDELPRAMESAMTQVLEQIRKYGLMKTS